MNILIKNKVLFTVLALSLANASTIMSAFFLELELDLWAYCFLAIAGADYVSLVLLLKRNEFYVFVSALLSIFTGYMLVNSINQFLVFSAMFALGWIVGLMAMSEREERI